MTASLSGRRFWLAGLALLIAGRATAQDRIQVVATLPTLAALAEEIGGERVEVTALSRGDQDPHTVTPTPVLMRRTREADLFIENGFTLELWADEVANGSGNSRIFRGAPGRLIAGEGLSTLEVPAILSREMGDIHPQGNPHVWLDPLMAKVEAANIAAGLRRVDPAGASYYDSRLLDFEQRIDVALFGEELLQLIGIEKLTRLAWSGELHDFLLDNQLGGAPLRERAGGWLAQAWSLDGAKAYEFHKVWAYFARLFGLELAGTIEERPGIPPGPQYTRTLIERGRTGNVGLILVDNFYPPDLPNNIAREIGARVAVLPNQVGGEPEITTYFELMDHILDVILDAAAP
jgi:zinc/manganese transport system substrate-binding protein